MIGAFFLTPTLSHNGVNHAADLIIWSQFVQRYWKQTTAIAVVAFDIAHTKIPATNVACILNNLTQTYSCFGTACIAGFFCLIHTGLEHTEGTDFPRLIDA